MLERLAYLNAGTFGPLAQPTADAVRAQLDDELEHGRFGKAYFERMLGLRSEARAALGSLVGVAAGAGVADGLDDGRVQHRRSAGLDLGPDDEIVTTREEHFGLLGPLHASGARVVVVDAEPEAILAAVTPRTRLLALSQVLWTTGRVLPVRELREQTGVPVLVDGAQSVGAIPVDAQGLDFLTISGQKWLCGPDATGALVVADPERLARRPAELLLADRLRGDGQLRAGRRRRPLRPRLDRDREPRRARGRARAAARVALRARRGA